MQGIVESARSGTWITRIAQSPPLNKLTSLQSSRVRIKLVSYEIFAHNRYTEHVKVAAERLGLSIRRADEIYSPEPFMVKVWQGICAAQLVLADCTEKNANVFYEVGIAHTVGKKVVLITRSERDIPSDIKHFDYTPYAYTPDGVDALVKKLKEFLRRHFDQRFQETSRPEGRTGSATDVG